MALFVYRDKSRTQILYAKDALKEDKNIRFYCPNPNCDAHMYICSVKGSSSAYFRAVYKQHQHILDCPFHSSNGFNPNNHDEEAFDFENSLKKLMLSSTRISKRGLTTPHRTGKLKNKPLKTIRQIYDMCKSYVCTDEYNHVAIGQMLVDDRSAYMYPKGVFGYRIIEGMVSKGYFYNTNKLEIKIAGPIRPLINQEYMFILKFEQDSLFKEIKNITYENRDKIIVVAGNWKASGAFNAFYSNITSKKQITIIM